MTPDWIAVDWGTSHLRIWLMQSAQAVRRIDSEKGMGQLSKAEFEPVLLDLLADHLPADGVLDVLCCGMVGSRQGWAEARYANVPCTPPGLEIATLAPTQDPRLRVHILPGVKQDKPADVMRGEETQIAGALAVRPGFDGVICLPGTHCKWAHISAGEIVSFRTFMTGEMFALLSGQSVLRHSIAASGWDAASFDAAVDHALSRPAALAGDLFSLRAEALLQDLPSETARARLSGLLIGAELAAAKPYWLGQNVMVLGEDALAQAYVTALAAQGVPAELINAESMTLRGLTAARASEESRHDA